MSKFILKTLLFIFPLLILLAVTEYKARSLTSDFAVKRENLEQNIDRAEVIVAGSSHAYEGIKPKMLGVPAVSIAFPGQDFYYDSQILLEYLPKAFRAKLVIVTVSYFSFEYMMEGSEGKGQTNFYDKYWKIPRQNSVPHLADYSALFLFGLQRSRDFLLFGKTNSTEVIDESGGNGTQRGSDLYKVTHGEIAIKRHESGMQEKYIARNYQYLDGLFSVLKERNIQAVIITTPCYHTYYDNLKPELYQRMQSEIEALRQKYGLEYDNYLKDERFTAEDFADSDHLNTQGAEKFSTILKNEVVKKYISLP